MKRFNLSPYKQIIIASQEADLKKYKEQADAKKIDKTLQATLLDGIRNGNMEDIDRLVNGCEYLIIDVIEAQNDFQFLSIEEMFNAGRKALNTLAERELGSRGKERFFSFRAWWLRQAILKETSDNQYN